jgi:glyoxylase-like metal-dependent hydrolase (beta-lactamase superfamily II)
MLEDLAVAFSSCGPQEIDMIAAQAVSHLGSRLNRRSFLGGTAALGGLLCWPELVAAGSAPYTFKQGDFSISVFTDGHLVLPTKLLAPDAPPAERQQIMAAGGSTGEMFEPPTNPTLIRTSSDLILFDTGANIQIAPAAAKLPENLAAAGIDPASITKVVFTHGHPDHLWGTLLQDGTIRYPKASFYVAAAEWNFWNDKDLVSKMPKEMSPMVTGAQRHYAAIENVVTMIKPGDDIVTGIRVLDTPGHTPGHVSFEVGGGDGLILVGDAVLAPWVYFPHPEWTFGFDSSSDTAVKTRKQLLDRAATDKIKLIGYHWPSPGVGYAERKGSGYVYVPAS